MSYECASVMEAHFFNVFERFSLYTVKGCKKLVYLHFKLNPTNYMDLSEIRIDGSRAISNTPVYERHCQSQGFSVE